VISAVPATIPLTIPVAEPTVATLALLLVQVPLVGDEPKVVVAPSQTVVVPLIALGVLITVTLFVAKQPSLSV
jgi:hypothetical protein